MKNKKLFKIIDLFEDSIKNTCTNFKKGLVDGYKTFDFATALLFLQQGKAVRTVDMPEDVYIYVHYDIFLLHDPDILEPIVFKLDYKDIIGLWEMKKSNKGTNYENDK